MKLKPRWSASVRAGSPAVCSFEFGSRPFCEQSWASLFSPVKWSDIPREHLAHASVTVCMLEADTPSAKENVTGGNTRLVLAIHLIGTWARKASMGYEEYLLFL